MATVDVSAGVPVRQRGSWGDGGGGQGGCHQQEVVTSPEARERVKPSEE